MTLKFKEVNNLVGIPDYDILEFKPRNKRFALVIPVINESYRIIEQLRKIKRFNPEVDVIIADGGSTDESIVFFQSGKHSIKTLLIKKSSGGLSSQLRMAFHYCVEQGYEAVITMDGNDKDGPEGINVIVQALDEGFDFVQGSRFLKGGVAVNTPLIRYLAIRLIHAPLTSLAAGVWFTDTTNGFRGHGIRVLQSKQISVFRDVFVGYELLAYLPIRICQTGFKVCEVPVSRIYPDGKKVPTKIRGIGSQLRILGILLKSSCGRFNP
jgi:glycosyltransferase involved in cell wall biosynthesis